MGRRVPQPVRDLVELLVPLMSKSKPAPRLNCSRSAAQPSPALNADVISTSRHANMKELRGKVEDRHLRVLCALDPRRAALLLLGGDKTGDPKWYNKSVPIADDLFDHHLKQLEPKRPR